MLASTAASLRPPLRRFRGGGALPFGAHRGGMCAADPLFPRPRRRALACRADLQQDAPFAAAIGACVLASLVLPPPRPRGEVGEEVEEGAGPSGGEGQGAERAQVDGGGGGHGDWRGARAPLLRLGV